VIVHRDPGDENDSRHRDTGAVSCSQCHGAEICRLADGTCKRQRETQNRIQREREADARNPALTRYLVLVTNIESRVMVAVEVAASGPYDAQAKGLRWVYVEQGWNRAVAGVPREVRR
jgi:hypothetical protein